MGRERILKLLRPVRRRRRKPRFLKLSRGFRLKALTRKGFYRKAPRYLKRRGYFSTSSQLSALSSNKMYWAKVCERWCARALKAYRLQHYFVKCVRVSAGIYLRHVILRF